MPNILLTNFCNRKCPYCFAKEEMKNAGERKGGNELPFKNLKIILDFLEKSGEKTARLMGGEPTLHSQFEQFINYILSRGFKIHIFTNGLFSQKITGFLAKKVGLIKYSFNIDPLETYSSHNWNQILENLKILSQFGKCLIGRVIWQENFDIDYLSDLSKKYSIKIVMLRIANPMIGGKNRRIDFEKHQRMTENIIREIKKAREKKIQIGFGCGFSKKIFTPAQQRFLKKNVVNLKWGCDGNSGRFDIVPDLTVFRCFPLSGWKRKKLADFKNTKEAENCFEKLMLYYQSSRTDDDFIHQGPCFTYLLRKNLKK